MGLSKQQTEMAVIGVGVLVLVFVLASNLKKKPEKKPGSDSEATKATAVIPELPGVSPAVVSSDTSKVGSQKERVKLPWGRDPFAAPSEKEYQISDLQLKGVSISKDERGYAFINSEIVRKGDKVGDYEVANVEKDRVLLKRGNQNFYIVFPEE